MSATLRGLRRCRGCEWRYTGLDAYRITTDPRCPRHGAREQTEGADPMSACRLDSDS